MENKMPKGRPAKHKATQMEQKFSLDSELEKFKMSFQILNDAIQANKDFLDFKDYPEEYMISVLVKVAHIGMYTFDTADKKKYFLDRAIERMKLVVDGVK